MESSGFGEAWATDLVSSVTLLQAVTQAQRRALRSLVNEQLQVSRDRPRRLRHRQGDWADHLRMPAGASPRERNAGPP